MKQINITRDNDNVTFEPVSIDPTETVFFTNLDSKEAHWPTLASNQIGAAPSANSSECPVPPVGAVPYQYVYGCKIAGHESETGTISVFVALAAADDTALKDATKGQPITEQPVVVGGLSPYDISDQQFQVNDNNNNPIQSGSGSIGPGLKLSTDGPGITVTGTPSLSGTYNFTFTVNDAAGRNLQGVQYSMKVN